MAERTAGIVLGGGRSKRMGASKATLEWHGSTLVRRAAGLVARAVAGPVVVVRAAGQELPPLPEHIEIATDAEQYLGPLHGIAAGLEQLGGRAEVVFVTGVDAPLLHPALIAHVLRSLRDEDDAAMPYVHGWRQHLAAAYRVGALAPALAEQIDREQLAVGALSARLRAHELDEAKLLADPRVNAYDPQLDSLLNLNTPDEYAAARAREAPRITVLTPHDPQPQTANAATLAAAAQAARATRLVAILDGHGPIADPHEPLATGDHLTFDAAPTTSQLARPW